MTERVKVVPMNAQNILLADADSTRRLGKEIASRIDGTLLLLLSGQLGAGKTTVAQGIGQGLDLQEEVTSPTFTMLNEYASGRLPFYHFDLYRLSEDLEGKDFASDPALLLLKEELEEFLSVPGVVLVEWAELGKSLFAGREHIQIRLCYNDNAAEQASQAEDGRLAVIEGHGKGVARWLDTFCLDLEKSGLNKKD